MVTTSAPAPLPHHVITPARSTATPAPRPRDTTGTWPLLRTHVPPVDYTEHFGGLLPSGEGADVKFKTGGETFAAHRCVLTARSPVVFRARELLGATRKSTTRPRHHDGVRTDRSRTSSPMCSELCHTSYYTYLRRRHGAASARRGRHRYDMERLKLIGDRGHAVLD
uniref:BTB domain-containing protein n=1 Tax=Oryza meridionalis TaxID=40149 RepID=A0A0E0EY38_9ORYZ